MQNQYSVIIKKSDLTADNAFLYEKLCFPNPYMVECSLTEEKEEVHFEYLTAHLMQGNKIRNESRLNKLAILIYFKNMEALKTEYQFSMSPDNFFYDVNFRVRILQRDVYEKGYLYDEAAFLKEYKALVGHVMQKKYLYDDYMEGGLQLLNKNPELKPVYEATSLEELVDYLEKLYQEEQTELQSKKIQVNRAGYRNQYIYRIVITAALIVSFSYCMYLVQMKIPRMEALAAADNAYIDLNYIEIINALEDLSVSQIPLYQRYILAIAYIKSENLNAEQKNNVLGTISITTDEKKINYWIYLGRLDTAEAINLAMQSSDDELLLYAYLKEKFLLENNATLQGEEKLKQLSEITSKIDALAKKYDTN